jgi:hypothetical protein
MKYAGRFYFISWHGRLLQGYTNGEMHASQEVQNVGQEERWNVYVWPDGKLSFQNFRSNKWLCAEPNGRAVCDRPQPDIWEKWTLHGISGRVAFQSYHNKFLCAQPPGQNTEFGGEVIANRPECKEWERFSMIPAEGVQEVNNTWWNSVKTAFDVAQQVAPIIVPLI